MANRKKILFVIESLTCAGAEKSLVTLLSLIDYKQYEVDLQLFAFGGEFDELVPKEVNVLPHISYNKFLNKSLGELLLSKDIFKHLGMFWARISYSIRIRKQKYSHPEKAQIYWESVSWTIEKSKKMYDVAIAYAQGVPTFYVMDKVAARKKICWVNANVVFSPMNIQFQERYYRQFDSIVTVSDLTYEHFNRIMPTVSSKVFIVWDIVDVNMLNSMSNWEKDVFKKKENSTILLTVSRLNQYQKGMDIALETAKILKSRKVNFQWYVLGRGDYEMEMRRFIADNGLENELFLLGVRANPYPYYREADIYVQTSRNEGYGLSIAEARLLNTPVVTTQYDSVYSQMVDRKNGLVTEMNPGAVADAIVELINDEELYRTIVEYQQKEKKGNAEELEKFYWLIEQ